MSRKGRSFDLLVAVSLVTSGVEGWLGGNVIITIMNGFNLPNLDSFGPMGGETDTYVKVRSLVDDELSGMA